MDNHYLMEKLSQALINVKKLQTQLVKLNLPKRNQILKDLAQILIKNQEQILKANQKDIKLLQRKELEDRLELNPKRISAMVQGLKEIAKQEDPLNKILETKDLPNGLKIQKISVPLGVVGVIYESRPNVTMDLAGLCIKSGNGLVLKGGSEAYFTNKILVELIHKAVKKNNLPSNLVYLISPKEEWKKVLLNAYGLLDVIIPRGSEGLIKWVRENSKIPIIETGAGVCHTFVDAGADLIKASDIITNSKVQRPSVCNALDTVVLHQSALNKLLPILAPKLSEYRVEIFADQKSFSVLKKYYPLELLKSAKPEHFGKEFLSLKMSIKTAKNFEEGLEFIKKFTSGHSEAILSRDNNHIQKFLSEVDAAVVYSNASTRFTDGEQFGMGGEVGISTQKLHARGPMGLAALTSYKWVVKGNGQIRK
jgi:glutamate-5-semialdehyde dehydrogenase